jgi:hypothetical protein
MKQLVIGMVAVAATWPKSLRTAALKTQTVLTLSFVADFEKALGRLT